MLGRGAIAVCLGLVLLSPAVLKVDGRDAPLGGGGILLEDLEVSAFAVGVRAAAGGKTCCLPASPTSTAYSKT